MKLPFRRYLGGMTILLLLLPGCQKEGMDPGKTVPDFPSPAGYAVIGTGADESFPVPAETANCYILAPGKGLQFPPVKGNSAAGVGDVASVAVLWESTGSSTQPLKGSIVSALGFRNGQVQVRAGSQEGNAVIAAYSADKRILWSWHIWVTSADLEACAQTYAHAAGIVMDRNLGALSPEPGSVAALGLLYQWGRKDPFPGSAATDRALESACTVTFPEPVSARDTGEEMMGAFATAHPTSFITGAPATRDWYAVSPEGQWGGLWGSDGIKSLSDPCPPGWMVPPYDLWTQARILNSLGTGIFGQWDSVRHGMSLDARFCGTDAWFPAAGLRHPDDGKLYATGESGYQWTHQSGGMESFRIHYFQYGQGDRQYARVYGSLPSARASAQSVRCVRSDF